MLKQFQKLLPKGYDDIVPAVLRLDPVLTPERLQALVDMCPSDIEVSQQVQGQRCPSPHRTTVLPLYSRHPPSIHLPTYHPSPTTRSRDCWAFVGKEMTLSKARNGCLVP